MESEGRGKVRSLYWPTNEELLRKMNTDTGKILPQELKGQSANTILAQEKPKMDYFGMSMPMSMTNKKCKTHTGKIMFARW